MSVQSQATPTGVATCSMCSKQLDETDSSTSRRRRGRPSAYCSDDCRRLGKTARAKAQRAAARCVKSRCTECGVALVQPPVGRPRVRCESPQCLVAAQTRRDWLRRRDLVEVWDRIAQALGFASGGYLLHRDDLPLAPVHRRLDGDNDYPITPDLGPWAEEFLKDFPAAGAEVGVSTIYRGWLTLGDRAGLP